MKCPTLALTLFSALASNAGAQVAINEYLAWVPGGGEDMEFIELIAQPGFSLDGYMLAVVEVSQSAFGDLELLFDLTGYQFPAASRYFVAGDDALSPDYSIGVSNVLENDFENAFYLLHVPDASVRAQVESWVGTNILSATFPGPSTRFVDTPGVTIIDSVKRYGRAIDGVQPGALTNPTGMSTPGGAFRPGDCPAGFCTDLGINLATSTPGAPNPTSGCDQAFSLANCGGPAPFKLGEMYCTSAGYWPGASKGFGGTFATGSLVVSDNDFTLHAAQLQPNAPGIFIVSRGPGYTNFTTTFVGIWGQLCLGGSIGRFTAPNQVFVSDMNGSASLSVDLQLFPQSTQFAAVQPGETWYFQAWHRLSNSVFSASLSNPMRLTFE